MFLVQVLRVGHEKNKNKNKKKRAQLRSVTGHNTKNSKPKKREQIIAFHTPGVSRIKKKYFYITIGLVLLRVIYMHACRTCGLRTYGTNCETTILQRHE